jgi:rhamnulokinase
MSTAPAVYLAFDLGASSGRAVVGLLEGQRLRMKQICRFSSAPVSLDNRLRWDVHVIWRRMLGAMRRCAALGYRRLAGIGIDAWGVDFGLLGRGGTLLANPICYRDLLTEGVERHIRSAVAEKELFRRTGRGIGRVSTLSQLVALGGGGDAGVIKRAETLLMIPDLFRHFLSGHRGIEHTTASTSQLVDVRTIRWSAGLFRSLRLPRRIMPELVRPGTVVGRLRSELAAQAGLNRAPVVAVAGHDTASAAAAAPWAGDDGAFLSCGTWSVVGVSVAEPIATDEAFRRGCSNVLGLDSVLFAKFAPGLYLLEGLRRSLKGIGAKTAHACLLQEALRAKPFSCFLDMTAPMFFAAENPRAAIGESLRRTGQKVPRSPGAVVRAILEGLAFMFRGAVDDLAALSGRQLKKISLVGGGARNRMLCQMVADVTGLEVIAGPAEAAAAGNLAIQALATGRLSSAAEVRELVRRSFRLTTYRPQSTRTWEKNYPRYLQVIERFKTLQ